MTLKIPIQCVVGHMEGVGKLFLVGETIFYALLDRAVEKPLVRQCLVNAAARMLPHDGVIQKMLQCAIDSPYQCGAYAFLQTRGQAIRLSTQPLCKQARAVFEAAVDEASVRCAECRDEIIQQLETGVGTKARAVKISEFVTAAADALLFETFRVNLTSLHQDAVSLAEDYRHDWEPPLPKSR